MTYTTTVINTADYRLNIFHQFSSSEATISAKFQITSTSQGLKNYTLRVNFTEISGSGNLISDNMFVVAQGLSLNRKTHKYTTIYFYLIKQLIKLNQHIK